MHFHAAASPTYHAGTHKHVETPYDKHSQLYQPELWLWHDLYDKKVSYASDNVVTRSQTAFNRIEIGRPEMEMFGNAKRHHPPNLPHLMLTMKDGMFGAIPRTIVTRSMASNLETNPILMKTLQAYESFEPLVPRPPLQKNNPEEPQPQEADSEEEETEVAVTYAPSPLQAEKPSPKNTRSCTSMCMKKQNDDNDTYASVHKPEDAPLSTDEPARYVDRPQLPFFSSEPPLMKEAPKNPLLERESPLSMTPNPFFLASSDCSHQECFQSRRETPSMAIGVRPNSRAGVTFLPDRMRNLSMGPKTVQRLQI